MSVHVFGIRHHGPGGARSLRAALAALGPDVVLVEGPPDATEVLPLLHQEGMKPPVALLIYPPDTPQRAIFYPFAIFSPEWQALHFALEKNIPARFIDLPQSYRLALEAEEAPPTLSPDGGREGRGNGNPEGATAESGSEPPGNPDGQQETDEIMLHEDPLGLLAIAAGYRDHELWWEHQIEQRQDPAGLFDGIMEAMTALRSRNEAEEESQPQPHRRFEEQREAFMRQSIRSARKEGFERIAVVCGAWHAPALTQLGPAKTDLELLKGLPKVKVAATWVPWTYSRLAYRSGYGAGVTSPGWYDHLWNAPAQAAIRWAAQAARLLRNEDLDASSASVIEAVRLADALAALRDLPMAGLAELNESLLTVLCHGDPTPMWLIRNRLEIGEWLGTVPKETPAVALQKDLDAR